MNSLVVMDFMRLRSPLGFSLSRRNVARDVLALNKRRAMGSGTRKGWQLRCFNSLCAQHCRPRFTKSRCAQTTACLREEGFSPFACALRVVAAGLQPRSRDHPCGLHFENSAKRKAPEIHLECFVNCLVLFS
jgi:hypothetical protein